MRKYFTSLLVIFCAVLMTTGVCVFAADPVTDFNGLSTALTSAAVEGETAENPTVVQVGADIDITAKITIAGYKKLVSAEGARTLYRAAGNTAIMLDVSGANSGLVIGEKSDTVNTLTLDGSKNTADSNPMLSLNSGLTVSVYNTTFKNHQANGWATIQVAGGNAGKLTLDGVTISNTNPQASKNLGALALEGTNYTVELVDINIINNRCSGAGAIYNNCTGATINFRSGTISGNGSTNQIRFNDRNATFNMYGGTIDGTGTYSCSGGFMYFRSPSKANFYGGTIQNKTGTAAPAMSSEAGCTLGFYPGDSGGGVTFKNCTAATNINGGAIEVIGTVNLQAATFDNCTSQYYGAVSISGGTLNITGNIVFKNITTNDNRAMRLRDVGSSALNISGNARIAPPYTVYVEPNKKINISAPITTVGAVATIYVPNNNTATLTGPGTYVSDYCGKFAGMLAAGGPKYGYGADGKVSTLIPAPAFVEPDAIVLNYDGEKISVTANSNITSALLLIASYDVKNKLVDYETFDVSLTQDVPLEKTLKTGFVQGTKIKVMLWNSRSDITPMVKFWSNK